jgi:hypothetical protein
MVAFLESFDPIQVRYGGSLFRFVVDTVYAGAQQTQNVSHTANLSFSY